MITQTGSNNEILDNEYGLVLYLSTQNRILNNNASSNNYDGIYISNSHGNTIMNNTASDNRHGINIISSDCNNLTFNIMEKNGILLSGTSLANWNTHDIDTTNTVNGMPVYYYKNQTGGLIPSDGGEVILANCSKLNIKDQILNNGSVGVEIGFSSNSTIFNTTISDDSYGIFLYSSQNTSLINCSISNSISDDFYLEKNSHVIALNTTFTDAKVHFLDSVSTLTVKWYLHVNVTNVVGEPTPNAPVCIKDKLNSLPSQRYKTDTDGYARWLIETEYINRNYIKTYYTPHKITAWNEPLMGYAEVNMNESKEVNVVLDTPYYEISLYKGWNLVSLPLVQPDTSISTVLSSIAGNYDKVEWYNTSEGIWHTTDSDLTDLDHTMGFWIHMKTDDTLVVTGDITNSTSIQLYSGWNLIGNPSFCIHEFDEIFASITGNYTAVQWFDAGNKDDPWKHYQIDKPQELNDLKYITCGRGYWIYVNQDCVWEVSNF